jgi:hypothetical protein
MAYAEKYNTVLAIEVPMSACCNNLLLLLIVTSFADGKAGGKGYNCSVPCLGEIK